MLINIALLLSLPLLPFGFVFGLFGQKKSYAFNAIYKTEYG